MDILELLLLDAEFWLDVSKGDSDALLYLDGYEDVLDEAYDAWRVEGEWPHTIFSDQTLSFLALLIREALASEAQCS